MCCWQLDSQLAYVAVSYVRREYESGEVTVWFVAAKPKVAPTKATSIPRLELMAAVESDCRGR